MSKVFNGVTCFEPGEKDMNHRAFKELSKVSLGDVRFPFGFFLVEEGGKTVVIPGTEQDRRETLLKAFPNINPEAASQPCRTDSVDMCKGDCGHLPPTYKCVRMFDEHRRFLGCACVDWF